VVVMGNVGNVVNVGMWLMWGIGQI
jgi:hypothetical protein